MENTEQQFDAIKVIHAFIDTAIKGGMFQNVNEVVLVKQSFDAITNEINVLQKENKELKNQID